VRSKARSDIRLVVSKTEPNMKGLVRRCQEQVSHWWHLCLFTARLCCFFFCSYK